MKKKSIYDFIVKDNQGKEVSLSLYQGKILLIVNTAIHCGFTPQYKELETLYKIYQKEGLVILDFPCNQFHGQAPESDEEINHFCQVNYQTTFPRFQKIDVKGDKAEPLFTYLCKKKKFLGFDKGHPLTNVLATIHLKEDPLYEDNPEVKWNFTKFLVDRSGKVVRRFEPTCDFKVIIKVIDRIIDTQREEDYVIRG